MEDTDPFDNIPDNLRCPICLEVPLNKVFQCKEGHTICDGCYSQITLCPQCRLPFGPEPIRTLLVEQMLDELILECPHKQAGCNDRVDRKTARGHLQICRFGTGPPISVCKALGFKNCSFTMNRRNVSESIQHLKSSHETLYSKSNIFHLNFTSFDRFLEGQRASLILDQQMNGFAYLFIITTKNDKDKCISWNTFYWKYPSKNNFAELDSQIVYHLECSLQGEHSLTWRVPPVNILKSEDQSSPSFSMDMPAYLFVDKDSGNLSGKVEVIKKSCS